MAFDVEGKLYKKFETNQVTDTFRKREFILEMEDGAYTQLIKFQLTQNNCEKLDPFGEGDKLKVTFSLRGREYKKPDSVAYFTNLDAWRIESAETAAGTPSAAPELDSFPSLGDEPVGEADSNDDLPF